MFALSKDTASSCNPIHVKLHKHNNNWFIVPTFLNGYDNTEKYKLQHTNHPKTESSYVPTNDVLSDDAANKIIDDSFTTGETEGEIVNSLNNVYEDGNCYDIRHIRNRKRLFGEIEKKKLGITSDMTSAGELILMIENSKKVSFVLLYDDNGKLVMENGKGRLLSIYSLIQGLNKRLR
jgi:hypothetical protein